MKKETIYKILIFISLVFIILMIFMSNSLNNPKIHEVDGGVTISPMSNASDYDCNCINDVCECVNELGVCACFKDGGCICR